MIKHHFQPQDPHETVFLLVRHGQSVSNLAGFFAGQTDVPLSDMGHLQAARVGAFLQDVQIDAIYASELERTVQTGAPTADSHGLSILRDARLNERHMGCWETRQVLEVKENDPVTFDIWRVDRMATNPEGAEHYDLLRARGRSFILDKAREHRGQCVGVFTHALFLQTLYLELTYGRVTELSTELYPDISNASITVLRVKEDGRVDFPIIGYTDHLGELTGPLGGGAFRKLF